MPRYRIVLTDMDAKEVTAMSYATKGDFVEFADESGTVFAIRKDNVLTIERLTTSSPNMPVR